MSAQNVANTLYATLGCQLHQFFMWCRVQEKLGVEWYREVLNDVPALPDACRLAFVRAETAPSASQRQVSETLVRMGLSVQDEARCPTSGYSIDMLVHDSTPTTNTVLSNSCAMRKGDRVKRVGPKTGKPAGIGTEGVVEDVAADGRRVQVTAADGTRWKMQSVDNFEWLGGERSGGGGTWAVEFDGPSHFLASPSRAPTGATLLKRRQLQLLGHALVSVPYWEWAACKGAGEREQYLRSKLGACSPSAAHANA